MRVQQIRVKTKVNIDNNNDVINGKGQMDSIRD